MSFQRITYEFGAEHGTWPHGAINVHIEPTGGCAVERRIVGKKARWEARLLPESTRQLLSALRASPFSKRPPQNLPPPGTIFRKLTVVGMAGFPTPSGVEVTWTDGLSPPWKDLFRLLDEIAYQVSRGAVPLGG